MKPTTPPWYLRPLYSRGEYSPRLTMAWLTLLFTFWLIWRWITTPSQILAGVLVQPQSVAELGGILLGFAGLLLGLGTFQKVKLDGPPPAPDTQITADTAPVSADTVTMQAPTNAQP
jgi:hypothetical protein